MATNTDFSEQISQSASVFLSDIDKLKAIEAVDRAAVAAAYERHAKKLIDEEVRPKIQEAVQSVVAAILKQAPPAPPPITPGDGGGSSGDLPGRVARLEIKVDKMTEDIADIKALLARMDARMDTFASKADLANAKLSIIVWVVGAIFLAQLLPAFTGWLKQLIQ